MTTLAGYYNRFNSADKYDALLFRASKGLQSAELNEIQSILSDRIQKISNVLFKDGSIVRDGSATIDAATGQVQMAAGAVYVLGAVREVSSTTFTIPTTGQLSIGVRVTTSEITEVESSALRDPATGTRNYDEPGAGRTKRELVWGWSGDGGSGTFYQIYAVENATLVTQVEPPQLDSVTQLIARYDRDSNGNYAVRGLNVVSQGSNAAGTNYLFTVTQGVGNVEGYKVDKPASVQKSFTKNPDLFSINNEPHSSSTASTQTVTLNYSPLNAISDCVVTLEKSVTISHGSFTGASDPLPDTAVLSIQSVTQGGTTYSLGTDFNLTSDQVDWSPGGAEPAPGSTYSVTYRYLDSVTPANINEDNGTFEVTGAVASTLILVDYNWKLPRYDVMTMNKTGEINLIKGVSSRFNPEVPLLFVPDSDLLLASIYYNWKSTHTPLVDDIGTRVTSMDDMRKIKKAIVNLHDLIAIERLERDLASKEPAAKYGTFSEPFNDDSLRDLGQTQDAVMISGDLQMPVPITQVEPTNNATTTSTLDYTEEVVLSQLLRSGSMLINPYQSFEPIPALVTLNPSTDLWTIVDEQVTNTDSTRRIGAGNMSSTWTTETLELVSSVSEVIEFMRQRSVAFEVAGFGPSENLLRLTFAGDEITLSPMPQANASGELSGSFTVPANVPSGDVEVEFLGAGGSRGTARYFAQGTLRTEQWVRNRVTTTSFWWGGWDPLAQTFALTEDRQISSVDLKFTQIGNTDNEVQVQIRETDNGFPTATVIGEAVIPGASLTTNNVFVTATFSNLVHLVANREYAIVVMTDDAAHACAIGEIGKYDQFAQTWITAQPFTIGTLLSSSNAKTWTPHQDMDLCFRLNAASFTSTSKTVDLGTLSVTNMSDLQPFAPVYLPSAGTNTIFKYTRSTGEIFECDSGTGVNLAAFVTDTMSVQAVLNGTSKLSPVSFPGMVTNIGSLDTAATYISRAFTLNTSGGSLKIYFDALIQGTATVTPEYDAGSQTWTGLSLDSSTPLGDGWVEYKYSVAAAGLSTTAIKLALTGTPQFRPRVRNLRAIYI